MNQRDAQSADPVSLLREVRQSLASMPGCNCKSCDLVTRIDEALRLADDVPPEHQGCTFECAGCYAKVVLPFTDATKTHIKVGPMQGWTAAPGGVRCPKCSAADVGDKRGD